MASAIGAGFGADMLQDILRRKLQEQALRAQIERDAAQTQQQGVRDQATLKHYGAMEEEAKAQTDMQRKRLEAELNRSPAAPAPSRPIALNGRLLSPEGKVLYEPPAAALEQQPVLSIVNGKLVKVGDAPKGSRIVTMPKPSGGGAAPSSGGPAASAQPQQNEVDDSLALIDQIAADPALAHAVGPLDQYAGGLLNADIEGVNRFKALHNQLAGKLALAQAGKLKGQGQISDKERALLAAAATALNRGLSENDYKAELQKIKSQFQRMKTPGAAAPVPQGAGVDLVWDGTKFVKPGGGL